MAGPVIPLIDTLPDLRERLSRVEVLYTDLDGTLLGRGACLLADGTGAPSLDAAAAITRLNAAGLTVVITSGRSAKQLREITRLLGWSDFIAELGTIRSYGRGARVVRDTGEWGSLDEGQTPYEAVVRLGALEALQQAFPGAVEYHDPWHLDREMTHVLRGNIPLDEAQAVLDGLPMCVTLIDNGIVHPPRHTLSGVTQVHAYHLVPAGCSKVRAIAADIAERGLERDSAAAIGDSAADLGMAEAVGVMAVVSNGLDDPVLLDHALAHSNLVATRGSHGTGWAEFADAWLAARVT